MKKIYLLAASFAICFAGTAQKSENSSIEPLRAPAGIPAPGVQADRPQQAPEVDNSRITVIWEDDFSESGNWAMSNEATPATDWMITTDADAPPFAALTPIMTPTVANGYALVDGDSQGDGSIQNCNLTMINSVDLTGYDVVNLRFYTVTRNYQSTYTVRVSPDNGATWTEYPVLTDIGTNTNTDNPELEVLNITDVAADASEVLVEFNFSADWGWFWAIDDVSIVVPDNNDMTLSSAKYASYDPDVDDNWLNVEYSVYDVNQLRELQFSATATNTGIEPQTDVYLEVNINNGAGEDVTLQSDPVDVGFNESVDFVIEGYTPPMEFGMYELTYTLIQNEEDNFPEDNVGSRSFEIADGTFARDLGGVTGFSNVGLGEFWGGPGYNMTEDATLYCIGAAIANTSVLGTFYDMELRDGLDIAFLAATSIGQVEEEDLNGAGDAIFTYQWMETPTNLFSGDDYVVMFHHFGGAEEAAVSISINDAPDFTSYVIASFEEQECDPCYTGSTYMVRMGLSQEFCSIVISVDEEIEQVSVSELFPNPTVGQTVLEYAVLKTSEVQIFLFDNQGRIVMNKDMGTQPVGEYRYDYDFSDLAAGQYMLSIQVDGKAVNKKLVIR